MFMQTLINGTQWAASCIYGNDWTNEVVCCRARKESVTHAQRVSGKAKFRKWLKNCIILHDTQVLGVAWLAG